MSSANSGNKREPACLYRPKLPLLIISFHTSWLPDRSQPPAAIPKGRIPIAAQAAAASDNLMSALCAATQIS
jgi:hypothetical protein